MIISLLALVGAYVLLVPIGFARLSSDGPHSCATTAYRAVQDPYSHCNRTTREPGAKMDRDLS